MKQNLLYILFSLASVISYGQVSLYLKQDKTEYNAKELVNITVVLELNGNDLDQQTQLRLPDFSKFVMVGSGSYNNAYVDPETSTAVSQSITRIALEPKQKGKIRIGSFLVTVNNRIYKTEPFDIFVRDIEKKVVNNNLSHDVFLNMEIDDKEVYQDQGTIAVLKVYSKNIDNLRKVKNIHLPEHNNFDVHPISFTKSDIDPNGIGNMPSQILAEFMVFPNEAGYVEVPPVTASVNTYSSKNNIVSNKVKINVKKLPEGSPESFKNAVGHFKVDIIKPSIEKIEAKKPVDIIVKVSGEGNLSNLVLPTLEKSKEYQFYPPNIISNLSVGREGLKGEVIAKYVVIPNKTGDIKIRTEEFSYFNPKEKEYIDLGKEELSLVSFSHDQVLEDRTAVEKVNDYTNNLLETVDSPVLKTTSLKVKEKDKLNWNILMLNAGVLSLLVILGLGFRKWQKKQTLVRENSTSKSLGSVAETENEIRNSLKTDINDYFAYLDKLNKDQNFKGFFDTIQEMDQEVRNEYFNSSGEDFVAFLEKYKGRTVAEDYKKLNYKIEIEKYSPIKSEAVNDDLLKEIINLYSQISK